MLFPAVCAAQALPPQVPVAPNIRAEDGGFVARSVLSDRWWAEHMAPITVQFPYEGQPLAAGTRAVNVRGKLNIKNAELDVNGVSAKVEPDGRFQAYVPVESGRFALLLTARGDQTEAQALRHVEVAGKNKSAEADAWETFAAVPAEVTQEAARLRSSSAHSGNLTASKVACGTVMVNGRKGNMCRINLGGGEAAWLEEDYLKIKEGGAAAANRIMGLKAVPRADGTRFEFTVSQAVPLFVREWEDRLELVFYYTCGFDERLVSAKDPLVRGVNWNRLSGGKMKFTVYFRRGAQPAGYDYYFEDGRLVLDLRRRTTLPHATAARPLLGAHILLDPGHSGNTDAPFDGTVGASGYTEYEAALDLARDLKEALEQAGARVTLTRYDNFEQVSLPRRKTAARQARADVMVSLHYDALPASVSPFKGKRGFSVFYSYPHSRALAQKVHKAYKRLVPLPDNGLHQTDYLALPRVSSQPTVLVENAFLMLPEQEDMARTKEGRAVFVRALTEGIEDFFAAKK